LFSTKEYKKTRVPYFTGEYEAWEERNGLATTGAPVGSATPASGV
jgi:hypothetical protein